jgi:hypothetical protein
LSLTAWQFRPLIRRAPASAKTNMQTVAQHLARTLGALGIAALTLLGIHRH